MATFRPDYVLGDDIVTAIDELQIDSIERAVPEEDESELGGLITGRVRLIQIPETRMQAA